jgi:hypothetical protein
MYYTGISPPNSRGTPGVFYTCFYNHAHRLRLEIEELLYLGLSKQFQRIFKPLLDPGGGFNGGVGDIFSKTRRFCQIALGWVCTWPAEKADEPFFFTPSLILKCQFRADPPKDSGAYFLVPITWYFVFRDDIFLSTEGFRVVVTFP